MEEFLSEHNGRCIRYPYKGLLQDYALVNFIAAQRPGTTVHVPAFAGQKAQALIGHVKSLATPKWLKSFTPRLAYKHSHEIFSARSILKVPGWAGLDTASPDETDLGLWVGSGLIGPEHVGFSNMWASESDIYRSVATGVRRFVADDAKMVQWIAQAGHHFHVKMKDLYVTVRFNPGVGTMGAKFGVPESQVERLVLQILSLGMQVPGVAYHGGTSNGLMYAEPEKYGMTNLPTRYRPPAGQDPFLVFANTFRKIAPTLNHLREKGYVGDEVNSEGGLRNPYMFEEWLWEDILASMVQAYQECLSRPIDWVVELGRFFGDRTIGVLEVTNVKRFNGSIQFACVDTTIYPHFHDQHWAPHWAVRRDDVLNGNIFTVHEHPDQFEEYHLVTKECAGSGWAGQRSERDYTLLPRGLKAGEVLWFLHFGSYMNCAFNKQPFLQRLGKYYGQTLPGFNGIPEHKDVVWPPQEFPIAPLHR